MIINCPKKLIKQIAGDSKKKHNTNYYCLMREKIFPKKSENDGIFFQAK